MNCQDIAVLMDERQITDLTARERDLVAGHVATCADCAGDWHVFERVHSRRHAEMPADFPERLWTSLAPVMTGGVKPGRGVRPWLLGGLLLVGSAAALVGWQSRRGPELERIVGVPESSVENSGTVQATPPQATGNADPTVTPTAPDAAPPSSLRRIVVLPTVYENQDQVAIDSVNAVRVAALKVLRTLPNLEVVEIVQAQVESADLALPDRRRLISESLGGIAVFGRLADVDGDQLIAAHFGGHFSLRFYNQTAMQQPVNDFWSIEFAWTRANETSAAERGFSPAVPGSRSGTVAVLRSGLQASAETRGDDVARELYGQWFPQAARAVWEMVVLDAAQPESRRVEALSNAQMRSGDEIPPGLADRTIESAIDLGRTSTDPATRSRIWQILGTYAYPAARESIIDALLYDPDATVRRTAARVLYSYIPDPAVSAALAVVAANDASDAVRLQARWSSMSGRERDAFVGAALRDPELSDEQKVAPLAFLRRNYDDPLDPPLLGILHEIACRSADPAVRSTALAELGRSAYPASLDALIDALHNDPESSVRQSALYAMDAHRRDASPDDYRVYIDAMLDVVRSDADLPFRSSVLGYLSRDIAAAGVREALEAVLEANRGNQLGAEIEELLDSTRETNR